MGYKSYKRRFYIVLLFSLISFSQYCAWNTFGPIATTAKMVFGWTNTQVAILASMDPITYLCSMLFFSWMMDEKGICFSNYYSICQLVRALLLVNFAGRRNIYRTARKIWKLSFSLRLINLRYIMVILLISPLELCWQEIFNHVSPNSGQGKILPKNA